MLDSISNANNMKIHKVIDTTKKNYWALPPETKVTIKGEVSDEKIHMQGDGDEVAFFNLLPKEKQLELLMTGSTEASCEELGIKPPKGMYISTGDGTI